MSEAVGRAKVEIIPDLTGFDQKVKAAVDEATAGQAEKGITEKLNVDDTEAKVELDKFKIKVDEDTKDKTTKVSVDTDEANKKLDELGKKATDAGGGIGSLVVAALGIGPALVPIGAVALGVGALLPVLASAGLGLGAFALAASQNSVAMATLKSNFSDTMETFASFTEKATTPVINDLGNLLTPAFSNLVPVVNNVSKEMDHLVNSAGAALQAPFWKGFISFLSAEAAPSINAVMTLIGGFGKALAGLTQAFSPVIGDLQQGLVRLGDYMSRFGQTVGSSSGFQHFLDYIRTEGPVVVQFFENLFQVVGKLIVGLAPFGALVLQLVTWTTEFANAILTLMGPLNFLLEPIALIALAWAKWGSLITGLVDTIGGFILELTATKAALIGLDVELATSESAAVALLVTLAGIENIALIAGLALAALGAVVLALATSGHQAADQFDVLDAKIKALPTSTLPQLTVAINATQGAIDKMNASMAAATPVVHGMGSASVFLADTHQHLNNQLSDMTGYLAQLTSAQSTYKSNTTELAQILGLSKDQVDSLASSVNINLTKALNTETIQQMTSAFAQMTASLGIDAQQFKDESQGVNESMQKLATQTRAAATATAAGWKSTTDVIGAFSSVAVPATQAGLDYMGAAIGGWYVTQVSNASEFMANISKAQAMGYDPTVLENAIQAGPQKAGALMKSLVSSNVTGLKDIVNGGQAALTTAGAAAVEASRLMERAIHATTSNIAGDYQTASAVSLQVMTLNGKQLPASFIAGINGGLPEIQRVAEEYGVTLPNQVKAQITAAGQAGSAQAAAAALGMASGKTPATAAGTATGAAFSTGVTGTAGQSTTAGAGIVAQVNTALSGGPVLAALQGAATGSAHADGLGTTVIRNKTAAELIANGVVAPLHAATAKAGEKGTNTGQAFHQKIASEAPNAATAGHKVAQASTDALTLSGSPAEQAGQKLTLDFAKGILDKKGEAESNARAVGQAAIDAVKGMNYSQIGASFAQGFASGINQNTGLVQAAAANAVNAAVAAANHTQKASSPARRVADEVGLPFIQGLAVGITDNLHVASDAVSSALNTLIGGAKPPSSIPSLGAAIPRQTGSNTGGTTTVMLQPTYHVEVHGAGLDPARMEVAIHDALIRHDEELIQIIGANL